MPHTSLSVPSHTACLCLGLAFMKSLQPVARSLQTLCFGFRQGRELPHQWHSTCPCAHISDVVGTACDNVYLVDTLFSTLPRSQWRRSLLWPASGYIVFFPHKEQRRTFLEPGQLFLKSFSQDWKASRKSRSQALIPPWRQCGGGCLIAKGKFCLFLLYSNSLNIFGTFSGLLLSWKTFSSCSPSADARKPLSQRGTNRGTLKLTDM